MSAEFTATLFSGSSWNGSSIIVGVASGNRYFRMNSAQLQSSGFFKNIRSEEPVATTEADANVILFTNSFFNVVSAPDYAGQFLQVSAAASFGDAFWTFPGFQAASVLLVAGNRKGHTELRVSFTTIMLNKWKQLLDAQLAGTQASRDGDPTLTWEMFPAGISYLSPQGTYLKISQPLHISMPWYWADYAASMTYHILLFIDGAHHLRAFGQRWAYWVESGAKAHEIGGELKPKMKAGLSTLVDQVNNSLKAFDKTPINDVYYLPGNQVQPIGTNFLTGTTIDDITIVIEI
jgi:hypothetical protein